MGELRRIREYVWGELRRIRESFFHCESPLIKHSCSVGGFVGGFVVGVVGLEKVDGLVKVDAVKVDAVKVDGEG